jgi:UDP-N-acetylmuramoyl-L-alanyl-D-glutamate--2,6-diaminopimelate ligase
MKSIKKVIADLTVMDVHGSLDTTVNRISFDSRTVDSESIFVAIAGTQTDGHKFIDKAIENGAQAVVLERMPEELRENVTYVQVPDTALALGMMSNTLFEEPSRKLKLVGVTGTNGKTTVTSLLKQLFDFLGYKTGLISTVSNWVGEDEIPSTHTTPDAYTLNALLNQMVEAGCTHCFMEVSSHALDQKRVAGVHFAGAIFTNITHDHLDYHGTFAAYIKAKKKLFDGLNAEAFAITNKDDKNGRVMVQNCEAPVYTYAIRTMADFKAEIMEHDFNGMLLRMEQKEVWTRLVGRFNASNLLAVYATAFSLGEDADRIITGLSALTSVHGRFDYVKGENGVIGIVDYAHTPDALANVLSTINDIRTKNETLITVVGCGGNRDKAKRPLMAEVACKASDKVILTSDNPRDEDPRSILLDMKEGVPAIHKRKTLTIIDREEAIRTAIHLAEPGDIILIAGKGHETYQEVRGEKHPL